MSSPQVSAPAQPMRSMQMIAGAMLGAIVFVAVAMFTVLPRDTKPPMLGVGILVLIGLLSAVGIAKFGYRTSSAHQLGDRMHNRDEMFRIFSSLTIRRLALAEVPMIVGLALGFSLTPSSWFSFAVGGVISVLLFAYAWPGDRAIEKVARNLERDGGRCTLREVLRGEVH